MSTILSYILVYLVGGVTFIPLVVLAILYHAYKTQPHAQAELSTASSPLQLSATEKDISDEELKALPSEISPRAHEPDVASGYFAVCREYILGGVDGKPPDKSASQTSLTAGESPSVYQSMYRSIFERGKTHSPSLETDNKAARRSRNVFYVVIRLGLLMLYEDAEQLEVRHVISLEHYHIDVYGGGDPIPEGELWVKRNCIRMVRREEDSTLPADARPFYLFANNCSNKEDFYHAMLANQGRHADAAPQPLAFEAEHMVKLIRQLHASEDNLQTRWINALAGRLFLSMYKTAIVEQFIRKKINKKLSRVPKPAFITAIQIRNIQLGDSAPFITGPKLKELTTDGDLTLEADVKYKGNARIDVAAIARIDLGARFKAREVQLLLAVICKSLEGHMYFRVKPPPSNRVWFSFVTMPKLDLSVEPVISSRQITYAVVLKAIESRIREVLGDTLVYPNWDDAPFMDTLNHDVRGGVWDDDSYNAVNARLSTAPTLVEGGAEVPMQEDLDPEDTVEKVIAESGLEASHIETTTAVKHRKNRGVSLPKANNAQDVAISSGLESAAPVTPKAMRSKSFASAAIPVVTRDAAIIDPTHNSTRTRQTDATSGLKDISSRSQPGTPTESPVGSPSSASIWRRKKGRSLSTTSKRSTSDGDTIVTEEDAAYSSSLPRSDSLTSQSKDTDSASVMTESSSLAGSLQKRQTLASTAAAAKKWGLDFVKSHSPSNSVANPQAKDEPGNEPHADTLTAKLAAFTAKAAPPVPIKNQPMGRGQPLPPPGTPLPGPRNRMTWTGPLSMLGRKKNGDGRSLTPNSTAPTTPIDIPTGMKNPRSPLLSPGLDVEHQSPSMEDLAKGSSIPRATKPKLPPRPKQQDDDEAPRTTLDLSSDGDLLILKVPENASSIETPSVDDDIMSPEVARSQRNIEVLPRTTNSVSDSDYTEDEENTLQLNISDTQTSRKNSEKSVKSDTPKPLIIDPISSLANPRKSSSSLLETLDSPGHRPSSIPSPVPASTPFETLKTRKARSRQSLLPTPTSSRKASPGGSSIHSQASDRRASTQSLQELTSRRVSNGVET